MPLTPENIAETWSGGGTVQISTPNDYTVFVAYMNNNTQSSTMRNAEITADLDFTNTEFVFYKVNINVPFTNITLDGKNHHIKNIAKEGVSDGSSDMYGTYGANLYCFGNNSTVEIKNVIFENMYITASVHIRLFYRSTIKNVQIKNCRFITTSNYEAVSDCNDCEDFSSAVTVRVSANYTAMGSLGSNSKRIAILDTVTRLTFGGQGRAFSSMNSNVRLIFTRNRFYNFETVYGIAGGNYSQTPSMSYVAIFAENATTVHAIVGGNPQNTATYYDNTLVPNAAENTQAGLPSATLKSVAAMQQHGFNVEAV